jgi:hypothetical protein
MVLLVLRGPGRRRQSVELAHQGLPLCRPSYD